MVLSSTSSYRGDSSANAAAGVIFRLSELFLNEMFRRFSTYRLLFDGDWLHSVVLTWRQCWRHNSSSNSADISCCSLQHPFSARRHHLIDRIQSHSMIAVSVVQAQRHAMPYRTCSVRIIRLNFSHLLSRTTVKVFIKFRYLGKLCML